MPDIPTDDDNSLSVAVHSFLSCLDGLDAPAHLDKLLRAELDRIVGLAWQKGVRDAKRIAK